jgi:hypothetical protein
MDDLEGMNKLDKENYYDREVWDEDMPCKDIPIEVHKEFELTEEIFNKISSGVNVKLACVIFIYLSRKKVLQNEIKTI